MNADGKDMQVRCYQHLKKKTAHSTDQVVMLYFHGGGFCIGDINTHHEFCHTVCRQTGWAVVVVDYRLAPEYVAPTALKDCIAAYRWLTEYCHTLGALASCIVLSGDSAGGSLAALVAQQVINPYQALWQRPNTDQTDQTPFVSFSQNLPRPLALLPLYPVTDYESRYPSWQLYGQGLLLTHDDTALFSTAYVKSSGLSPSSPLVSAMHGDSTNMCLSYIVEAELDILRDEGLVFAEKLKNERQKVQVYTVLGAPHGFIHLMSAHKGLKKETIHIINEFAGFVRQLLSSECDQPHLRTRA